MCGRFTQNYTWAEVHAFFGVFGAPRNLRPRYNIAPTTSVDVIRLGEYGRELASMRWGLVPFFWKKGLKDLPATFNAPGRDDRRQTDVSGLVQTPALHHPGQRVFRVDRREDR